MFNFEFEMLIVLLEWKLILPLVIVYNYDIIKMIELNDWTILKWYDWINFGNDHNFEWNEFNDKMKFMRKNVWIVMNWIV